MARLGGSITAGNQAGGGAVFTLIFQSRRRLPIAHEVPRRSEGKLRRAGDGD